VTGVALGNSPEEEEELYIWKKKGEKKVTTQEKERRLKNRRPPSSFTYSGREESYVIGVDAGGRWDLLVCVDRETRRFGVRVGP